jgi:hypothetical protein
MHAIRVNCEFDSNKTDSSERLKDKHPEPRISISRGIIPKDELERFQINL